MTVGGLIKQLKKYRKDRKVRIWINRGEGRYVEIEYVEIEDVSPHPSHPIESTIDIDVE